MVKLRQLVVARDVGLRIPETLVSQEPAELRHFALQAANGVVSKPIYGGFLETAAGPKAVYTTVVEPSRLAELEVARSCPTLLQHRIEKGVDVRLTVMDDKWVGVAIQTGDGHVDVRHGNMEGARYSEIVVPDYVMESVVALMQRFTLRFAAIDFIVSEDGNWYFLEVNPGGQWAWLDLEAKTNIGTMLLQQLTKPPG
jgi:glutathione synthase/RimK-type ligase-like ATP-grasp enzyme